VSNLLNLVFPEFVFGLTAEAQVVEKYDSSDEVTTDEIATNRTN
jgi:hypothetical protein